RLPAAVMWYCDPAGAQERADLVRAGRKVRPGRNALMAGIMKVKARLDSGRLRVVRGTCPNLLHEATLYRYEDEGGSRWSETPARDNNHALDALRYLVSRLDEGRRGPAVPPVPPDGGGAPAASSDPDVRRRSGAGWWRDEALWTHFG